jgi:hypothetical protein
MNLTTSYDDSADQSQSSYPEGVDQWKEVITADGKM